MTEILHVAAVQRLIAAARQEAPLSPVMTQCLDQLDAHASALATARAEIARLSAPPPSAHGPGWDERREAKLPRRLDLAAALADQEAARAAKKPASTPPACAAGPKAPPRTAPVLRVADPEALATIDELRTQVAQQAATIRRLSESGIAPSPVAAAPDTNIGDADLQARRAREKAKKARWRAKQKAQTHD